MLLTVVDWVIAYRWLVWVGIVGSATVAVVFYRRRQ
jgi:LPXTG-motif cell wall-anchored protein